MKVDILDNAVFEALNPLDIAAYLRAFGWQEVEQIEDKASIWIQRQKGTGEEFEILLPLNSDWRDFATRMKETIKTLAMFENRSQLAIKVDLETLSLGDVIQIRIIDIFHPTTLPLDYGLRLHQGAKEMLKYIAMSTVDLSEDKKPQPYYRRTLPQFVTEYLNQVRLAPSTPDGYVVKLISPLNPQLMKTEIARYSPPFERRVVKTLMRALNSLQKWLSSQQARFDFKAASEMVSEGVSAHLCDAIKTMMGVGQSHALEIAVSWSYRHRNLSKKIEKVVFPTEIMPSIKQAGYALRKMGFEEVKLEGNVVALNRKTNDKVGTIAILSDIDGKKRQVKVEVDNVFYNDAIRAHQEGTRVLCQGKLVKKKNVFTLLNLRHFYVL